MTARYADRPEAGPYKYRIPFGQIPDGDMDVSVWVQRYGFPYPRRDRRPRRSAPRPVIDFFNHTTAVRFTDARRAPYGGTV